MRKHCEVCARFCSGRLCKKCQQELGVSMEALTLYWKLADRFSILVYDPLFEELEAAGLIAPDSEGIYHRVNANEVLYAR